MSDQATHAPHNGTTRVVVLLGTNYSGSHLLSHLLSAHSQCVGVGELHRYQQLVASGVTAPVVSEYTTSPVFAALDQIPVDQWHHTVGQRYAELTQLGSVVIIDNSKKTRWVKKIAQAQNMDLRLVHLIRDPRALVLRWLNTYDTDKRRRTQRLRVAKRNPARAPQILAGNWTTVFLYKWLRENRQITQFMAERKYPHALVTYHDMVFGTETMLQRLMPRLGLSYEAGQLQFGQGNTLGTTKTAHAQAVQQSEIRPDLKWLTQLDEGAAQMVVRNKDINTYLAQIGLRFGDKGLEPLG